MIEFAFVHLKDAIDEIAENAESHFAQMNEKSDYGDLNVDWDAYVSAMNAGYMYAVTARSEGKLIGYAVYQISRNTRHKHIVEAVSNAVFVERSFRGKTAVNMLKFADEKLREVGVNRTEYVLNDSGEGLARIIENQGYAPKYKIWSVNYV